MRILVASLLVVAAGVSVIPTSQDLRSRYGEPDIERFVARPGISLTAEYGSDGQVCHILIEPRQPLVHGEQQELYMSSEAVTEILDEIVPAETRGKQTERLLVSRGKEISRSVTNSGCNQYESVEYEYVSIGRATHNCLPLRPEREISAQVFFKRAICGSTQSTPSK